MSIASDLAELDWKFRAKRSGQSPAEYAAAIERYRKPARPLMPWIITLALLVGAYAMARA